MFTSEPRPRPRRRSGASASRRRRGVDQRGEETPRALRNEPALRAASESGYSRRIRRHSSKARPGWRRLRLQSPSFRRASGTLVPRGRRWGGCRRARRLGLGPLDRALEPRDRRLGGVDACPEPLDGDGALGDFRAEARQLRQAQPDVGGHPPHLEGQSLLRRAELLELPAERGDVGAGAIDTSAGSTAREESGQAEEDQGRPGASHDAATVAATAPKVKEAAMSRRPETGYRRRITSTAPPASTVVSGATIARPSARTIDLRMLDPWSP